MQSVLADTKIQCRHSRYIDTRNMIHLFLSDTLIHESKLKDKKDEKTLHGSKQKYSFDQYCTVEYTDSV